MRLEDLVRYGHKPATPRPVQVEVSIRFPLEGEIVSIAADSFYREIAYPLEVPHGLHPLSGLLDISGERLGVVSRDAELAYAELPRAVFFDTETTGLGLGAGTYIFLVGAGFIDGGHFRVRQYFLGSPGDEVAYLKALQDFLSAFSAVVTFNGKAFDWPLLEGRYLRFRQPPPLGDPPHVDLLHPARRLWKRRLVSCALSSLEVSVLQVERTEEDVPGWEIPLRYFAYLRGDDGGLSGVFYHNLQDILSLATLAIHVDRLLADPFAGLAREALDFYSLGRIYERAGDSRMAVTCYEEALHYGLDPQHRHDALVRVGRVHKRSRWWEAALQAWERLLDDGGTSAYVALVEMAKFYEHVERDYARALDLARDALVLTQLRPGAVPPDDGRDLEKRLARLTTRVVDGRR